MPERAPRYSPFRAGAKRTPPRPSASRRGYDSVWQKLRLAHLQEHPLCVDCRAANQLTAASVVDHRIPHRGNDALRLDASNLDSLCPSCHSRRTTLYDGGFGRARKPKGGTS